MYLSLDNLLGNAAAYSGAGNKVLIKLWKEMETTTLTIENTGAHIPDEAISKLFEPFYRVDQSGNRQTGSTGLGLYIVKTILENSLSTESMKLSPCDIYMIEIYNAGTEITK